MAASLAGLIGVDGVSRPEISRASALPRCGARKCCRLGRRLVSPAPLVQPRGRVAEIAVRRLGRDVPEQAVHQLGERGAAAFADTLEDGASRVLADLVRLALPPEVKGARRIVRTSARIREVRSTCLISLLFLYLFLSLCLILL